VKVYFADLAYYHAALGVWYYLGDGKQGVIENFILLELDRKLSNTHEIRFYRKKSGAEVSFILIETSTKKLTPVIVTTKSSGIIPQSLKSFQESYGSGVEHAMILNDNIIEQKELNGAPVIIIPHVAI
jgi:predicted AAA+ superfamily ATPase